MPQDIEELHPYRERSAAHIRNGLIKGPNGYISNRKATGIFFPGSLCNATAKRGNKRLLGVSYEALCKQREFEKTWKE
jgi:hypothetical protein